MMRQVYRTVDARPGSGNLNQLAELFDIPIQAAMQQHQRSSTTPIDFVIDLRVAYLQGVACRRIRSVRDFSWFVLCKDWNLPKELTGSRMTRLLVVVGPHTLNLSSGIQQHHLCGLAAANIVDVVDDDCLCAPKCLDQVEAEIRKGLKTSEEVFPQCRLASDRAIAIQ